MRKVLFTVILATLVAFAAPAMASLPPTRPACEKCGFVYSSRIQEMQHDIAHRISPLSHEHDLSSSNR